MKMPTTLSRALVLVAILTPLAGQAQSGYGYNLFDVRLHPQNTNPSYTAATYLDPANNACVGRIDPNKAYLTMDEAKQDLLNAAKQGSGEAAGALNGRGWSTYYQGWEYEALGYESQGSTVVWDYYSPPRCSTALECCGSPQDYSSSTMQFTAQPPQWPGQLTWGNCDEEYASGGSRTEGSVQSYTLCPGDTVDAGEPDLQAETFDYVADPFWMTPQDHISGAPYADTQGHVCANAIAKCDTVIRQIPLCMTLTGPTSNTVEPTDPRAPNKSILSGFSIVVTNCDTGFGLSNVAVQATVSVNPGSGYHDHRIVADPAGNQAARPVGALDAQGDATITGKTGANGAFSFYFVAPEVSGTHTITANCAGNVCTAPPSVQANVQVNGLATIPVSPYYTLTDSSLKNIGDNGFHDGNNHYLTPEAAVILDQIGRDYLVALLEVAPPSPLYVNDASLPFGGLFDAGHANWLGDAHNAHAEHRRGTVVDIRANTQEGAIPASMFAEFQDIAWARGGSARIHSEASPNRHYHVRLLRRSE